VASVESERCEAGPVASDGLSSARCVHIIPRQDSTYHYGKQMV
jgi:hypothetical protein